MYIYIYIYNFFYNFPVCFKDFSNFSISHSPEFISSYSRFSRFSKVHGNPATDLLKSRIKQKLGKYP